MVNMDKDLRYYHGKNIEVTWSAKRCIHAVECTRRLAAVFDTRRKPWVLPDAGSADEVAETVMHCPSGALHFTRKDGGRPEAPDSVNSISLELNGPLHVRGEILVETPAGEVFSIDDPMLIRRLEQGSEDGPGLTLLRSERAMTDCRPISLFSVQSGRRLGEELGIEIDERRFRANIYADLASNAGFAEDELVGRMLRIGSKTVVSILERDPRCAMISIDPDTAQRNPAILGHVTKAHEGKVGVYAAVLVEGMVRIGDDIQVVE